AAGGRRVLHDRGDAYLAILAVDGDADTAKPVARRTRLARRLAAGVARVDVEVAEHALDHRLVELFGVGGAQRLRAVACRLDSRDRELGQAVSVFALRQVV